MEKSESKEKDWAKAPRKDDYLCYYNQKDNYVKWRINRI